MRRLPVLLLTLISMLAASNAAAWAKDEPPKRVLVLVLDQLRPDYVDQFDMRNVKALMRRGASFDNAYLGHMASETVITHNVITSGKLPRNMGWADEASPRRRQRAGGGDRVPCGSPARSPVTSSTCSSPMAATPSFPTTCTAPTRDRSTSWSARRPTPPTPRPGPRAISPSPSPAATPTATVTCTTTGAARRARHVALVHLRPRPAAATTSTPRRRRRTHYGTATTEPAWMYPLDATASCPASTRLT